PTSSPTYFNGSAMRGPAGEMIGRCYRALRGKAHGRWAFQHEPTFLSSPGLPECCMRSRRLVPYALLAAVHGLLTLPNLGATSLWDMDEGVNAECAREMLEADTWVVPTFNWELRTAKPVFLYWVQRLSFEAFGVSEWSARLPAALFG